MLRVLIIVKGGGGWAGKVCAWEAETESEKHCSLNIWLYIEILEIKNLIALNKERYNGGEVFPKQS